MLENLEAELNSAYQTTSWHRISAYKFVSVVEEIPGGYIET